MVTGSLLDRVFCVLLSRPGPGQDYHLLQARHFPDLHLQVAVSQGSFAVIVFR